MSLTARPLLLMSLLLLGLVSRVGADEGMWTFDNFPTATVAEKHGVTIDAPWLDAARLATVRLENGCTGSFASADGLVLTNNHCVWSCVRNLSSDERNLSDEGFLAKRRGQELRCPGQQVSVLVAYEDVTDTVRAAAAGLEAAAANDARKARLTQLESACSKADQDLRCETVTLYEGGQYFLYTYRRYDDVRLVFAPELDIAAFGGDPDNFNFPRWCLDMSFLRAYDGDGNPAHTPNHLRWRASGPKSGEPVLVTGHPGNTSRLLTVAELAMLREIEYPTWIEAIAELRGRMLEWGRTGDAAGRIVQQRILGVENGLKVRRNQLRALLDQDNMARKIADEEALRDAIAADPALDAAYGEAWTLIDTAMAAHRRLYDEHRYVENRAGLRGDLYGYARTLVRGALERRRPNEERYREYTDAALAQREQRLFAQRPINDDYERLQLRFSLEKLREHLGPDSEIVKLILGTSAPDRLANLLVDGTTLGDAAVRRALWDGGLEAVQASDDPMVPL
ncbi:MAG: S46 family peptidase, partial [Pseudomonadota bacterium]